MDRTERFYRIDQLLQEKRTVPLQAMMDAMDVSRATVKRDLEYLRDRLNAPIVWDRERRGYRYAVKSGDSPRYALPGMWFNATEVHALLTMEQLLSDLQPGLLEPHVEPLRTRIRMLLESGDHPAKAVEKRIRIFHNAVRPVVPEHFELIATATLGRQRLVIEHYNRAADATTVREVSPQRIVYYREAWYLDTWCHLRKGLRSFSMDAISRVTPKPVKARDVADKDLKSFFEEGYGIFSGRSTAKAVLRFSPESARWVSRELWHPKQAGEFDGKGHYVLTVPYSVDTEIIMDILRHGPDVEVLSPPDLRDKVRGRLRLAQAVYAG